jgi:uncharacterized protein YoxC
MAEDAINRAWESQESKLSKINKNINQLLHKFLSLSDTIQRLSNTVKSLSDRVQSLGSTVQDLYSTD